MTKFIKKFQASESGMRMIEMFYPTKKNDPEHRALFSRAMNRYKNCTQKKNISQIKREIQVCKKHWKCYPHHYFMYDLYRRDMQLTDDQLKDYIPHFYWYYLFLPHHRSSKFKILTSNKIITDQIFRSLKIPQPETLFYILNGQIYSPEMVILTSDRIEKLLNTATLEKIFVKPAHGSGGYGIHIFHKTEKGHYVTQQNVILNRDFLNIIKNKQDYIVQRGIKQDPEISEMYPGSINTMRIIVENNRGIVRIVCAVIRIGRGQSEVDNASSGGIFLTIDINNGKLGDYAVSYNGERFEEHPDTHFIFKNFEISRWNEITRFILEAGGKMPFFTYLGWDIAMTADGPLVIEINSNPAHDIMEISSMGLGKAFHIEDPDYYWKNPGKRI